MKTLPFAFFAVTSFSLATPALAQNMSDGYYMSNPSAVTYSAADGQPIAGISVTVQSTAGTFSSTSDSFGWAVFPTLDIVGDPTLDPALPSQEVVTLSISAPDYIPARIIRTLDSAAKHMEVPLVPKKVGGVTGWVTANAGGTFTIPGYGTLRVPAGVLLQDAYIQVATVPSFAQSTGQFEDQLVHQVWIGALDQGGNLVDAIPQFHAGITLRTTPTIDPFPAGSVYAESWVSRVVDEAHTEVDSRPMATPTYPISNPTSSGRAVATIPVAGGSNLVTRTWDAGLAAGVSPTPTPSGCVTTTRLKLVKIGSRLVPLASSPMRCGEYDNSAGGEVAAGETFSGSSTLSASTMASVKTTVKAVAAEAEASVGTKVEVNTTTGKTTSTVGKGTAAISAGDSLSGGNCFNATAVIGQVIHKYRVFHTARTVCPEGISTVSTNLGEFEVAGGVKVWWNDMEAGDCPGCTGEETPPNVPGNGNSQ